MAKFLKSFFHPSDKSRNSKGYDEDERPDFHPPLDGRRKLSISRSGRMKANKKRHSLTLDLYGEKMHQEKMPPKEYHVHGKQFTDKTEHRPKIADNERRKSADIKTPEEEIDNAFKDIDKT